MFDAMIPAVRVSEVGADAYLLDVREPDEWAAGHAPDAHHLPMMEVPNRLGEIPKDVPVAVICRSGGRSAQVVAYLGQQGWENVFNVDGGMHAWAAEGRPMVSETNHSARVI